MLENLADVEDAENFNNTLDTIVKRNEVKEAYLMDKASGFIIGEMAINTKLDGVDFDFKKVHEKYTMISIDTPVQDFDRVKDPYPIYTGSSLWTCECKQDFIHTHFRHKCDTCGTGINNSTSYTRMIQEL